MRICHVITRLIVGGAQENTLLTCRGLAELGHDVLLVSGPTTGPEGSLVEQARRSAFEYVELPELVRPVHPWRDACALIALRRVYRDWQPDVVHTHSSKAGILGRLAAFDTGVPHVVHTIHGMSFNRTQPAWIQAGYALLEAVCAARTDRIISVADAMTRASLAAGVGRAEQYVTVYSGMDVTAFDPAGHVGRDVRRELGISDDAIVVATVARLFRNKGYDQLVPAMSAAAQRNKSLRFLWIGDGADRARYESELAQRELRDRTTLVGLVRPGELPRLLSAADMLVHASLWEGLPRAVVQALLMERPAVSFDLDGAPEVVLHGRTGLLVEPMDVEGLADAILSLAADADSRARMGRAGRSLCVDRFDWRRMVDRIEAVYNSISNQNSQGQRAE